MKTNEFKDTKFAIYARKSDKDESESVPEQIKWCREYIKDNSLIVRKTFSEVISAKKPYKRASFSKMIDLIDSGEIDGIITLHDSRLSRNPEENGKIAQRLSDGKIKCIITRDRIYRPKDNHLIFAVSAAVNSEYSKKGSLDVLYAFDGKYSRGEAPYKAPLGYINKDHLIIRDNNIFHELQNILKNIANGDISKTEGYNQLIKLNLKTPKGTIISKNSFYNLLRNQFHYGKIKRKGKLFEGAHEPMITKEEYESINFHTTSPQKKSFRKYKFAHMIKCPRCGYNLSGDTHHKKIIGNQSIKEYRYYVCSGRKKGKCDNRIHINEKDILKTIQEQLESIEIHPSVVKWLLKEIPISMAESMNSIKSKQRSLIKNKAEIEKQIDEIIINSSTDHRYRNDDYDRVYQRLTAKRDLINEEIDQINTELTDILDNLNNDIYNIIPNLVYVIEKAPDAEINELFKILFKDINLNNDSIEFHLINGFE